MEFGTSMNLMILSASNKINIIRANNVFNTVNLLCVIEFENHCIMAFSLNIVYILFEKKIIMFDFQKIIHSETAIYDILQEFFWHSNNLVRSAALEVS